MPWCACTLRVTVICLSVCLSMCLSVGLFIHLSVYLPVHVHLSVCLFVCLSHDLFIIRTRLARILTKLENYTRQSVCLPVFVYLSYPVLFNSSCCYSVTANALNLQHRWAFNLTGRCIKNWLNFTNKFPLKGTGWEQIFLCHHMCSIA